MTRVIIGADHAAIGLKEIIKSHLQQIGIEVDDVGTFGGESVDYPDIACQVASQISQGIQERGILLCGTGLGMSMVANRFVNVRAALCNDLFCASMSRSHNDANILVMGGRIIGDVLALKIVDTWLSTEFEGGRHQRRLDLFNSMTSQ